MTYFQDGNEAMVQLETMIDKSNVATVLHALARICQQKGDHIESNWQDRTTAKLWETVGQRIGSLANTVGI